MKTLFFFNPLIVLLLVNYDCSQPGEPIRDMSKSLYFSSFELDSDTAGWTGYSGRTFDADAPSGGGVRSLRIEGGCIIPHAVRTVIVPRKGHLLSLELWGKKIAGGGGVSLRRADRYGPAIQVSVQETVWTKHRSAVELPCEPGDQLVLELASGGIVYGAMRVDLIELRLEE